MLIRDNLETFELVDNKRFGSTKIIAWKFILKRSPLLRVFYERLIQIVKWSLNKVLLKAYLSYLEFLFYLLNTLFAVE